MGKQTKITKSARDEDCTIVLDRICNRNPETTVLCHLPSGGMGIKSDDRHGAYGCSSCHDEVDGRTRIIKDRLYVALVFHQAVIRTQIRLIRKGLM